MEDNIREEIIREIQRVATEIEPVPLTKQAFKRAGRISENKVRYHFGSWNEAVIAAGLKPNASGFTETVTSKIGEEELLLEIGRVWQQTGKQPSESMMNANGRFSVKPYRARWRSWQQAVAEYVARYGEPVAANTQSAHPEESTKPGHRESVRKAVVLAPTYKPKTVANRPRILYGEPIDFRGLRYAPINEQGVVYLFGMVSREVGFLIESVRTDYPDCEGKRALDASGTKWQHVRIEFEYKSKNFVEHGHDPDGCDLIVCWIHDWEECPIEVLELRSAIRLLPQK